MIGSIRKHAAWLWWVIAGLTIVSFVIFMGAGPAGRDNAGNTGGYGMIYGHTITPEEFEAAKRDFYFFCWQNYGTWPDRSQNFSHDEIEKETYIRLLLAMKAEKLGIHVPDDVVSSAAARILQNVSRNHQPVPMSEFVDRVLKPEGLTAGDFQHYVRSDLAIQQLMMSFGLAGTFVTPQEASALYDHAHEDVSVQAVFFSATNYLSRATTTLAKVAQFYTNYMAYYREPDRVQVNYLWFNITNFLEQAKTNLVDTNFDQRVDNIYEQYGATEFADAKTPAEAKAEIRNLLIRQQALKDAVVPARKFVTKLFAMDPVKPENFVALAQKDGYTVHTSQPFAKNSQPEEFEAVPKLMDTAFTLNADTPYSDVILGENGIYVIGLDKKLPSSIPSFNQIRSRVEHDCRMQQAIDLARQAGTNFYLTAEIKVATGKTFAQAAVAAGYPPEVLPPFSLSSTNVPEVGSRVELNHLKQAAFSTPVGSISQFEPTAEGGFVLDVKSRTPANATIKAEELPHFLAQLRQARRNETFNLWINAEASRELRDIPFFQQQQKQQQQSASANQM